MRVAGRPKGRRRRPPARDLTAVGGDLNQRAEPGAEGAPDASRGHHDRSLYAVETASRPASPAGIRGVMFTALTRNGQEDRAGRRLPGARPCVYIDLDADAITGPVTCSLRHRHGITVTIGAFPVVADEGAWGRS